MSPLTIALLAHRRPRPAQPRHGRHRARAADLPAGCARAARARACACARAWRPSPSRSPTSCPRALTTFERRLLRETLLETAHELSGVGARAACRQLRRARLHRRGRARAALAHDAAPRARRRGHRRARRPRQRARAAQGPARSRAARALRVRARADPRGRRRRARRDPRPRCAEGDDHFGQGAMAEVLLDSGPDSVNELRTLLGDPRHPQRRRLIVVVLGELRAFDAVPELTAALRDRDDELCARACHALGKIGDPESAEPLAAVAMDGARPWFVRTAAAGACGQIGDPRTAGTLVEALDSEEWYPRNAAASALVAARGRRRRRRLQPRRLARARVGRALLGPARRRRAHRGDHRPRRRAASAGCAGSSAPPRAPARPPGSRSWRRAGVGDRPLRGARAAPSARLQVRRCTASGARRDARDDMLHGVINHIVLAYFVLLLVVLLDGDAPVLDPGPPLLPPPRPRAPAALRALALTPPISICAPAYNEAEVIVDAMRSMLGLRYPEHEVVLANDGSTDDTLEPADRGVRDVPRRPAASTRGSRPRAVRGVWRSRTHSNLIIIDKENGGKCRRAQRRASTSRATRSSAASTPTRCSSPRRW